ncbi:SGNH/GDSL hydrolase family protein [Fodinibius salsisoli]|uniref:SGNH/GDSL hydrolase family protein n=1 Tax=Fodinibius salsisoli TaxID=2820877 RepID=A0ABT3PRU4_9BACT|nr:SGNH/GDSL hydrolase family protein [Fodinibius salsisoli]MCW9708569.1 SGNH/GDSL hydrolase family protein [Fodinibius salsisoli]
MKLRKPLSLLILAFVITSVNLYSCKDFNDVTFEAESGSADFTTVAAVGNSLTAGFQSSALYNTGQRYSFPSLVAGQVESVQNFEQPLISDPGIGGRLELDSSLPPTDPSNTPVPTDEQGQPINADLDRPYNNLGVPGSILADFTGQDLPGAPYSARRGNNPFFDIVLRDMGATQAEQLAALNPTFVMFWLGNNDILRYVTSGGTENYLPPENFQQLYQASMQALAQTEAGAALFNIPDVASIPYVFLVRQRLVQQGAITFDEATGTYQLVTPQGNLPIYIETSEAPRVMQQNDFLLLPSSSYFAGIQSGNNPPPVSPLNPIPNNLVLDGPITSPPTGASEFAQARGVVQQYNNIIASAASSNGYALVDINARFSQILAEGGVTIGGETLRPVPGELFSFDGVHPSNQGHGVVANAAINAINNTFNANIQTIDISTIPRGIPVTN